MKHLYDIVSERTSKFTTNTYSTSFSLGIKLFNNKYHQPIYNIYGFVRLADEIVDTFHDYDKDLLLDEFIRETWSAIDRGISLNPVLNSFQLTVNKFGIDRSLIQSFLDSMAMDLDKTSYDRLGYEQYILGSAEVVGLMCLKVFLDGDQKKYEELTPYAKSLGSAFQKINFLRDMHADVAELGRVYFPNLDIASFNEAQKKLIEEDIDKDFKHALEGIMKLPQGVKLGVYVTHVYYYKLFEKIRRTPAEKLLHKRIRIPDAVKYYLILTTYLKSNLSGKAA